jgi:hypothetical protein
MLVLAAAAVPAGLAEPIPYVEKARLLDEALNNKNLEA